MTYVLCSTETSGFYTIYIGHSGSHQSKLDLHLWVSEQTESKLTYSALCDISSILYTLSSHKLLLQLLSCEIKHWHPIKNAEQTMLFKLLLNTTTELFTHTHTSCALCKLSTIKGHRIMQIFIYFTY